MIGLILAGGNSTRLYPFNKVCSKQMLPIYDKPLIYYPISNLLLLGIKEFVIIIKPNDKINLFKLLGDGKQLGIKIYYVEQEKANGIPEALILGEKYLKNKKIAMILGDNIFYGNTLTKVIQKNNINNPKCKIFLYEVDDPKAYGVATLSEKNKKITKLVEKPSKFLSRYAITGLYIFNKDAIEKAKKLKKSDRGEYEIIDLLKNYLKEKTIDYQILERGFFWIDAGTPNNIFKASQMIQLIENRNKNKIACIEEICFSKKFINKTQYKKLILKMPNSEYKKYLESNL